MTALQDLLQSFRDSAQNERDKGTLFEHLAVAYLLHERFYADYYEQVWTYADWAATQDLKKRDSGIDLVAQVRGTGEFHAIQCKFFAPDYRVQKADIDSFFTASGKKTFAHRLIITTTDHWKPMTISSTANQRWIGSSSAKVSRPIRRAGLSLTRTAGPSKPCTTPSIRWTCSAGWSRSVMETMKIGRGCLAWIWKSNEINRVEWPSWLEAGV